MARKHNKISISVLKYLSENNSTSLADLKKNCAITLDNKSFYDFVFRLTSQGLVEKIGNNFKVTSDGQAILKLLNPKKDGVWKIVIFDIPEKHKKVRIILRGKLKQLNFKKWQNSIWVSPYELDKTIEEELKNLGEKFFIRLIKSSQINIVDDLEKMFK